MESHTSTMGKQPASNLLGVPHLSSSQERLTADTAPPTPMEHDSDYDPCKLAKIASPFYMYNHDSPRPSADLRHGKPSLNATERDMELGEITPSVTQEKITAQKDKKFNIKFWQRKQECMTKPKKQWWLQRLPKKQRYAVKAAIALIVIGTMIGIAVGIAAAVNSPVNGSDKTVGEHDN